MSLQGSSWELAGWVDHGMYEKLPDTLDSYGASWYGEKACPYLSILMVILTVFTEKASSVGSSFPSEASSRQGSWIDGLFRPTWDVFKDQISV